MTLNKKSEMPYVAWIIFFEGRFAFASSVIQYQCSSLLLQKFIKTLMKSALIIKLSDYRKTHENSHFVVGHFFLSSFVRTRTK